MRVHHAHQRGPLPREILQGQQGDAAHGRRPKHRLSFLPVSNQRQLAAGFRHPVPDVQQPFVLRPPLNDPVVHRLRHAPELLQLMEVRQHLILAHFKGEHGLADPLPHGRHALAVIHLCGGIEVVQIAFDPHLLRRVLAVPRRADRPHLVLPEVLGGIEITLRVAPLRPVEGVGSPGVQPVRQEIPGLPDQRFHPFLSFFIAGQFVSQRQHHKGGMVPQRPLDFPQLRPVIVE